MIFQNVIFSFTEAAEKNIFLHQYRRMNNLIHAYSSKPLLYGIRDSVIVAIATVVILVLFALVYYFTTGNIGYMISGEYWMGVGKSFLLSFILGMVYEYFGINARFSAESMRYAKGSTLSKYERRNEAIVATIAADQYRKEVEREIADGKCNIDLKQLNNNIDKLSAMVRSTRELKVIGRMYEKKPEEILSELKRKYNSQLTIEDIKLLTNLDERDPENNLSRLNSVSRLVELFGTNENLIKYFMKNGFSKLRSVKSMQGWTIDVKQLARDTGVNINTVGLGGGDVPSDSAEKV